MERVQPAATRVIVVSPYAPSPVGHGGNHRSYQILCDVQEHIGATNVVTFNPDGWEESHPQALEPQSHNFFERAKRSVTFRRNYLSQNPLRLLARTNFSSRAMLPASLLLEYRRLVEQSEGKVVCIIEHPKYEMIREINTELGIPAILCSHNLDALSQNLPFLTDLDGATWRQWQAYASACDLVGEIRAMTGYQERLLISRAEAAFVGALGLESQYYPYVPTGVIRERNERIREERSSRSREPGLFVLMGSGAFFPTRKSLQWFVHSACKSGLPTGVRVVVVGHETDKLAAQSSLPVGLELLGWLDQRALDDLLTRCLAVLVPQKMGFGSLTRLPELACAGIPVVSTSYPTYAIDPTPGLRVVNDIWDEWCETMARMAEEDPLEIGSNYRAWERRQARTMSETLVRYVAAA